VLPKLILQTLYGVSRMPIVVLVVEWQIANLKLVERKFGRSELYHGINQLAVTRVTAKTSDHYGNFIWAHADLLQ
jgi:hypothetical protein